MVKCIDYLTCAPSITRAAISAVGYNKTHFIIGERSTPGEETNLFPPENRGLKKLWQHSSSQEGGLGMAEAVGTKTRLFFNECRCTIPYELHGDIPLHCRVRQPDIRSVTEAQGHQEGCDVLWRLLGAAWRRLGCSCAPYYLAFGARVKVFCTFCYLLLLKTSPKHRYFPAQPSYKGDVVRNSQRYRC